MAQAYEEEDILVRKQPAPVTITLLAVSCVALIASIWLSAKELGYYVNPKTRTMTNQFQLSPVRMATRDFVQHLDKMVDSREKGDRAFRDLMSLNDEDIADELGEGSGGGADGGVPSTPEAPE